MSLTIPESDSALGNIKVTVIPTVADLDAITATEANGSSAIKADVYMMPDWGGMTGDQATGSRRRFAEKVGRQALGTLTRALEEFTYSYLPQAASSDVANKLKTALVMGSKVVVMIGYGKDPATAWAADDVYTALECEAGYQRKNAAGSDEFAELSITQRLGVVGNVVEDAEVA